MHVRFPFKNNILNYKVINWYYNSTGVYVVDLFSRRKNQNISVSTLGVYVVDLFSRRKNQNISVSTLLSSVVI